MESSRGKDASDRGSQGVAASAFATRAVVVAAVFAAMLSAGDFTDQLQSINVSTTREYMMGKPVKTLLTAGLTALLATAIAALVSGVLMTLLQTRGAFGIDLLDARRARENAAGVLLKSLMLVVACGVGVVVLYKLAPDFLSLIGVEQGHQATELLGGVLSKILKVMAVIAAILAVVWALGTRLVVSIARKERSSGVGRD